MGSLSRSGAAESTPAAPVASPASASNQGKVDLNTADISAIGRNTQGVRLIQLDEGDHLISIARLAERDDEEPAGPKGAEPTS